MTEPLLKKKSDKKVKSEIKFGKLNYIFFLKKKSFT